MIYFGENERFILSECEQCKREVHIERAAVTEENMYEIRIAQPVKCSCGCVDEFIRKNVSSTYEIRAKLALLSDLLRKKESFANKIKDIQNEINFRFPEPNYLSLLLRDLRFSLRIFLTIAGIGIGLEVLSILTGLVMFAVGSALELEGIPEMGNAFLYNVNIFKSWGTSFVTQFGLPPQVPAFDAEAAQLEFIYDYLPYAIAGLLRVIIYTGLIILAIRLLITAGRLFYHKIKQKLYDRQIKIRRSEMDAVLAKLEKQCTDIGTQAGEIGILPADYCNTEIATAILRIFLANRADTIREAINLYHEEERSERILTYQRMILNDLRKSNKYSRAMYLMTYDQTAQVDIDEAEMDFEIPPLVLPWGNTPVQKEESVRKYVPVKKDAQVLAVLADSESAKEISVETPEQTSLEDKKE